LSISAPEASHHHPWKLPVAGLNFNIISAKGVGDTHPVAPNDTAEGRAQNRRIEIVMEGPGA
jgi:flagellar motor protein MotB